MGITSLQVCMDSSDWFQGTLPEEVTLGIMDSSSSPITPPSAGVAEDSLLACSRPLMERRLRPQHEQSLKCPRCESTHTKFCYYNNYSLSQPRYFCKTCRRYWTKGGTLRNIPVGGGCRKNKKVSSTSSSSNNNAAKSRASNNLESPMSTAASGLTSPNLSYNNNSSQTDLHLAFPEQIHFSSIHAAAGLFGTNYPSNFLLEQSNPQNSIDFMENKYEAVVGGTHQDFNGGFHNNNFINGICSPFGMVSSSAFDQRLMLPPNSYENIHHLENDEVKPNPKMLSLEWQDHHHQQQQQQQQQAACNSDAGESFGHNFGGLGSWTGLMSGYGSSATNPLV